MSSKKYDIIENISCENILITWGAGTIFKVLKVYGSDKDSAIGKLFVINKKNNTANIYATSIDNGQPIQNQKANLTIEVIRYGPKQNI